jgi:hypothetical protein
MTDFTLPPFTVDFGGWWIDVDLHGDIEAWARRSAEDVLARWGAQNRRRAAKLAAMLEQAAQITRRTQGANMALLLYPVLGEGIRAALLFFPIDVSGHDQESGWQAMLDDLLPPAVRDQVHPEITEMATAAGPCRRVRFEQARPEPGGQVIEQLAYLWMFPQYGAGVIMSTTFQNLAEAGRWRPAIDELATSAKLDATAGTPHR